MKNQRGEVTLAAVAIIAVLSVVLTPLLLKGSNPFDRSADPANRRTASAISGRDVVEITNTVANSEKPVTVKIDRSMEASSEVTDPKLTFSQKVGRFIGGLGFWTLVLIGVGFAVYGVGFPFILWRKYSEMKQTAKATVAAIRDLDDDTAAKVKPKLAEKMDRKHKRVVDKLKMELN